MSENKLRVAIVGGGIGGLSAANALSQRAIHVRVYEQADALTEVGAGVALQPNGVRMLRRLGFGEELLRLGARWLDPQFLRADGSHAASMWPAELAGEIEFYGMHRADLLGMLTAPLPPDIIATGRKCVSFRQDDARAVLAFANGERATADVVIAADGIHSRLQRAL
jgi:salicylate hydroxylase